MVLARVNASPQCAVLLAVYNGMQYLEEQVDTILNQQDVHVSLFVSVDLSTDGSLEWFYDLSARDSRVIVLPYGEKFGGAARNFFRLIRDVNLSPFDFVAFADQDDHWYLNKLSRAIHTISASHYDAYSSNVIAFWEDGKRLLINKSQSQRRWDYVFEAAGPGCTYVMTAKLMCAIKNHLLHIWDPLQSVSLHDWFCYAFARANGFKWYIDDQPSMLYRQHANNQVGVNLGLKAYANRFKKIRNGWWLTQALLISELIGISESRFIRSWSRLRRIDLLRLSLRALQCRRRLPEQIFFFWVCLVLCLTGSLRSKP
ncbi:glycosyltransferase [Legionella maceachernii]|uniref:Putative glycosyl transferase n=1 Tax=Legionella maceachernii TaxID=466 RepID=A0A0W0WCU2_9GAMM|nr:glycosyltransferase [Legionella maceachernii]KTD30173.1 putative glycosyl transferase [Legionella maceachernii]SJZ92951.1 rhamnosyltransferase [Legionella maceachernii]SUP03480.1 putative glycosyl transferase [Legionella maceachernii]